MRYCMLIHIILSHIFTCEAIWWWFSDEDDNSPIHKHADYDKSVETTQMQVMFAPFEISLQEEKFLLEAQHYLQNIPALDQCNLLIINRLKSSCKDLSDEDLSKVSVNLLNCQSAVEGRPIFKCTQDMKLADCTKDMDSDVWNAYHIISNRARAICYNVRQTEFRMRTEKSVNNLASAALENINMLKILNVGQKQLENNTNEAMVKITHQHEKVVNQQKNLQHQQKHLGNILNENIDHILAEKRLIASRSKQVEEYTHMINEQLASLVEEIKSQDEAKKQGEKEILKDLDTVKEKANEVLKKLENAFVDMDSYHDNIESKQNKTLQNLEEIQKTIIFMNDVIGKLYSSFNEQMPWLHDMLGGTVDRLTFINIILGHALFFIVAFFMILFVNAPYFTRYVLLFLTVLNCITKLQGIHHLSYNHLSWLLASTIPVNYLFSIMCEWWYGTKCGMQADTNKINPVTYKISPLKVEAALRNLNQTFDNLNNTNDSLHNFTSTPAKTLINDTFPRSVDNTHNLSATNNSKSFSKYDTTIGGSFKCSAKKKNGQKCKNTALTDHDTCRVHTPQK